MRPASFASNIPRRFAGRATTEYDNPVTPRLTFGLGRETMVNEMELHPGIVPGRYDDIVSVQYNMRAGFAISPDLRELLGYGKT